MHDKLVLMLALAAGAGLGAIFFGGLWWTVRHAVSSTHPAIWFLGSLLARTTLVLTGFYLVSGGQAMRLLLCLGGFVVSRLVVTWLTTEPREQRARAAHQGSTCT